jgi:hypothetical protein
MAADRGKAAGGNGLSGELERLAEFEQTFQEESTF